MQTEEQIFHCKLVVENPDFSTLQEKHNMKLVLFCASTMQYYTTNSKHKNGGVLPSVTFTLHGCPLPACVHSQGFTLHYTSYL